MDGNRWVVQLNDWFYQFWLLNIEKIKMGEAEFVDSFFCCV